MRIATSSEMKDIESCANRRGISYLAMMERAGEAAARLILECLPVPWGKQAAVVCGSGNNGGDGFVAAGRLRQSGMKVCVILAAGSPRTEHAQQHYRLMEQQSIVLLRLEEQPELVREWIAESHVIVDALYGTGFHGSLPSHLHPCMEWIRSFSGLTVSLDLPSGVNADTGEADEKSIRADVTVAFDSLKPAHLIYPGREHCGEVVTADIGIPADCGSQTEQSVLCLTDSMVWDWIPARPDNSHKGSFGTLLNVSSSLGMSGAGKLSSWGAHRVGTGLVYLATPASLLPSFSASLTETIVKPLPETAQGTLAASASEPLLSLLESASACLIGCGLGANADTREVLHQLLRNAKCPLVIDADGLNCLAGQTDWLRLADVPMVLAPHPKEMARLIGCTTQELLAHRMELGKEFAANHQVVLLLKGAHTLIFTPDGRVFINTTGNSGLAKGGSGDVLSGMIAGFLAQGMDAVAGACCGAFLHGRAGDRCSRRLSKTAMQPSDLLEDLCGLFLENKR